MSYFWPHVQLYSMSFIDWLKEVDRDIFTFINAEASMPALDGVMILMRNALTWIPLYAFILYWVIRHIPKFSWQFILFTLLVFAVADYGSASIIKPLVARLRPCHVDALKPVMRSLVDCGGYNSFPSTHASNHFGLATFWFLSFNYMQSRRWYWLWVWAFLIGYAQIYVGKHYPFDIVGGAVFGILVGLLWALIFKRYILEASLKKGQRSDAAKGSSL